MFLNLLSLHLVMKKIFFGLRDEDTYQSEKSYGVGSHRREWLKQNPQYNYKN